MPDPASGRLQQKTAEPGRSQGGQRSLPERSSDTLLPESAAILQLQRQAGNNAVTALLMSTTAPRAASPVQRAVAVHAPPKPMKPATALDQPREARTLIAQQYPYLLPALSSATIG